VYHFSLHAVVPSYSPFQGALSRGVYVPTVEIIAGRHSRAMDSEVRERPKGLGASTDNPVNAQHGESRVDRAVLREHGPQSLLGDNLGFVVVIGLQATIVRQAKDGHVSNGKLGWGTRAIRGEDGVGDTFGQKRHNSWIITRAIRAPVVVVRHPKIPARARMRMRCRDKQAIYRDTRLLDNSTSDLQMQQR
jgi:hypothetical protein